MTEQFSTWDAAAYLETDEDIAAYLDACFEEGGTDAAFIIHALRTVIRAKGADDVAESAGFPPERLDALLDENASPGFGEILRIIDALGLRLHADKAA
jgi:probable addiction module antidote protein